MAAAPGKDPRGGWVRLGDGFWLQDPLTRAVVSARDRDSGIPAHRDARLLDGGILDPGAGAGRLTAKSAAVDLAELARAIGLARDQAFAQARLLLPPLPPADPDAMQGLDWPGAGWPGAGRLARFLPRLAGLVLAGAAGRALGRQRLAHLAGRRAKRLARSAGTGGKHRQLAGILDQQPWLAPLRIQLDLDADGRIRRALLKQPADVAGLAGRVGLRVEGIGLALEPASPAEADAAREAWIRVLALRLLQAAARCGLMPGHGLLEIRVHLAGQPEVVLEFPAGLDPFEILVLTSDAEGAVQELAAGPG